MINAVAKIDSSPTDAGYYEEVYLFSITRFDTSLEFDSHLKKKLTRKHSDWTSCITVGRNLFARCLADKTTIIWDVK